MNPYRFRDFVKNAFQQTALFTSYIFFYLEDTNYSIPLEDVMKS